MLNAACENIHESEPAKAEWDRELNAWFLVSGDADDFIFYGETAKLCSEK